VGRQRAPDREDADTLEETERAGPQDMTIAAFVLDERGQPMS
jgi:hypothetical protein